MTNTALIAITMVLATSSGSRPQSSSTDRGVAIKSSINGPTAMVLDSKSHLYVIEEEEDRVLRIDLEDGTMSIVAGNRRDVKAGECVHQDAVPATKTCLKSPTSLAVDSAGNLYIGEMAGYVRKVDVGSGLISTVAGTGESGTTIDGGFALFSDFWDIVGLAVAGDGDLFIADGHQGQIFKVDGRSGVVTLFAGNGRQGFAGDGESAKNGSFRSVQTIALDAAGNLMFADVDNCRIRQVEHSTRTLTTLATTAQVRQDGSCKASELKPRPYPSDAVEDSNGDIYFVEGAMDVVKRIDAKTRIISTVVGTGVKGYKGDGGPADQALLNNPSGLAIDEDGNLYISEFVNNRIRRVDAKTKIITTAAGTGMPHRVDIEL